MTKAKPGNWWIKDDDLNNEEIRGYNKNAKRNRKRLIAKLWKKIKNIRHSMHYKTANFLLDNFSYILLPKFETQKMSNKQNRKIGKSTVKDMLSWAHYEFQQHLIFKSQRRDGINKVILV